MRTARVLFLDIDGVLNSEAWFARQRGRGLTIISNRAELLDPAAVAQLNRVVEATGCKVVLSSSWRLHQRLLEVQDWLQQAGFIGQLHDRTPSTGHRGEEIGAWLGRSPCDRYAIVDDEPDLTWHEGRWVPTTYSEGLTAALADRLIALLREGA